MKHRIRRRLYHRYEGPLKRFQRAALRRPSARGSALPQRTMALGEGAVFGVVVSGVDDRAVESAARRALAAASSLGAEETRAGAAIYPRDARSAEDLLVAAGQALEAAFEIESPSAIVLSSRGASRAEGRYRAAR